MKQMAKSIALAIAMFIGLSVFVGCAPKPSNSEIAVAVRSELQSDIPVSWVGNLMGGKNTTLSALEIKEWGTFNREQKYWPIKIRVAGIAELNDPFNQGKVARFDKIAEFRFTRDDYGKWRAILSGGMFQ